LGNKDSSYVKDHGTITGKDTVTHNKDGSSTTLHQNVVNTVLGVMPTTTTGVTHNSAGGTSTNHPK